jgi:DNA-directed RNA polymerase specialized sigma24 family protein
VVFGAAPNDGFAGLANINRLDPVEWRPALVGPMEAEILELIRVGDAPAATAGLLKLYGAEVYGYMRSLLKDDDEADEAFAQACENALLAIAAFRGEGSLRTWFYVVARHAALHELRKASRRRGERISLWQSLELGGDCADLQPRQHGCKHPRLEEGRSAP